MTFPTQNQVLERLPDYTQWLITACKLQDKSAHYYAKCVRKLVESVSPFNGFPFTDISVDNWLLGQKDQFATAWNKRHGFMKFWSLGCPTGAEPPLVEETPTPTLGQPLSIQPLEAFSAKVNRALESIHVNDASGAHFDLLMKVAKESPAGQAILNGNIKMLDITIPPAIRKDTLITPTPKLYTEEELQFALEKDRGKEGRSGRDSAREVLKEVIGKLLGGKTLSEINQSAKYAHANLQDLKRYLLSLVEAQTTHITGLNLIYDAVLGHPPAEDLGGGKKTDEILNALPKQSIVDGCTGGTDTLFVELVKQLGIVFEINPTTWLKEKSITKILEDIHNVRQRKGEELAQFHLREVAEAILGLTLPPGLDTQMLYQQIEHQVVSLLNPEYKTTILEILQQLGIPRLALASPIGHRAVILDKITALQSVARDFEDGDEKMIPVANMWEEALRTLGGRLGGDDFRMPGGIEDVIQRICTLNEQNEQRERMCVLYQVAEALGMEALNAYEDKIEGVNIPTRELEKQVIQILVANKGPVPQEVMLEACDARYFEREELNVPSSGVDKLLRLLRTMR